MKNLTKKSALAIGVLASSALCGVALSAPNTFAVETAYDSFPDKNFLGCVVAQYNALNPTKATTIEAIDVSQVASLEVLNCNYGTIGQGYTDLPSYYTATAKITNTGGIKKLTGLKTLYLSGHSFSSIDLSANTKLRAVSIGTNANLTSLDLHYAPSLQTANVGGANLSSLNLTGLKSLAWLQASHNNLSTLDLSTNTGLQSLEIVDNKLTSINVSAAKNLGSLFADNILVTPYTEYSITDQCEVAASLKFVGVYNTIVKRDGLSFNNESHILTLAKRPEGNGVSAIEVMSAYQTTSATYRIVLDGLENEFAKLDKCEVKKQDASDDANGSGVKVPDTGGSLTEETNAHIIEASIIGIVTVATLGLVGAYIHNRRQNHVKF